MNASTLIDKIWSAHRVVSLGDDVDLLYIDRIFLHERTGSIALRSLADAGRQVRNPRAVFVTIDHIVETTPGRRHSSRMPGGEVFIEATRQSARAAGVTLFDSDDPRQGIVHVVSPEQGIALPGVTLVCPDSHTSTVGGLGALAWGIGSSDAEHALATQTLAMKRPPQTRVRFDGHLGSGARAKDLILYLIGQYGAAGGAGHAIEFAGSAIEALDVEGRFTLCNMAVEFGAWTGIVAPDDRTIEYVQGRTWAPGGAQWDAALAYWRTLRSDEEARFERELAIDARDVKPQVTWGTSPQQVIAIGDPVPPAPVGGGRGQEEAARRALEYMGLNPGDRLTEYPIDAAFIGSCTNSRLTDLREAAAVLRGRRVAAGVRALCVPGSTVVKKAAEEEGIDRVFKDAGFEWHEAGCSMCFYAGGATFPPGSRVISSTNRPFEGRQGPGVRTHLASPATVAASAILGRIGHAGELS